LHDRIYRRKEQWKECGVSLYFFRWRNSSFVVSLYDTWRVEHIEREVAVSSTPSLRVPSFHA
jgi:hypothetical protein